MILVDTSAWIDFFRGNEPMATAVALSLENNQATLCGPVLTELLRGFKSKRERDQTVPLFDACRFLLPPEDLWENAGHLGFQVARAGKSVKTLDLLIAVHAISHSVPLLTSDQDFLSFRNVGLVVDLIERRS